MGNWILTGERTGRARRVPCGIELCALRQGGARRSPPTWWFQNTAAKLLVAVSGQTARRRGVAHRVTGDPLLGAFGADAVREVQVLLAAEVRVDVDPVVLVVPYFLASGCST